MHRLSLFAALVLAALSVAADPLPSWKDGHAKQAITSFVTDVTNAGSPDFVPPAQRIAVFDNDGTLWVEQPMYTQLAFILDRVKALAPSHPEWQAQQPFKAALEGDLATLGAAGTEGLLQLAIATHSGMTSAEFETTTFDWHRCCPPPALQAALYPSRLPAHAGTAGVSARERLQDLHCLRRRRRLHAPLVRGGLWRPAGAGHRLPRIQLAFEMRDGKAVVVREPKVTFIDDGAGKPVGIQRHIGRRPILAFGNSDGDLEMLQWTTGGAGRRLGLILHHTDGEREYAYDRKSPFGRLAKALDLAPQNGWVLVSMKEDWSQVFASAP